MKKFLCIILSFLFSILTGCTDDFEKTKSDTQQIDEGDITIVINDYNAAYMQSFDYELLSELTGITFITTDYTDDKASLKLLAGDSDVDIYFFGAGMLTNMLNQGIYVPFESDIISDFNAKCFDFIDEFTRIDGQAVLMPIGCTPEAILISESAIEETGVTAEDIKYLDGYLNFARSYEGERIAYTNTQSLFYNLGFQYDEYFCDFDNGKADYMTQEYMYMYEQLWKGFIRGFSDGKVGATTGFEHNYTGDYSNNSEMSLCTYGAYSDYENFTDKRLNSNSNAYLTSGSEDFFEKWRAFPIPRISDKVTKNMVGGIFAVINPSSKNKEAAVKVLEAIAENFYKLSGQTMTFLFEDKSMYPERYRVSSNIFNDFYNIMKNSELYKYILYSPRPDIDEYQNGRATLEEAVEMYQREVEMWLNE